METAWQPPFTFEEKLKYALIPPGLYLRQLARRAMKSGERELHLLPMLVDPAKRAVDVGANKGVYTYFLARLAPAIEAFEPNPKMYTVLSRALPANATAHRAALSDRTGAAQLLIPGREGSYSNQRATLTAPAGIAPGESEHAVMEVAARTLDSYGFTDVGFIKIDVEGHEREVLAGARVTIAGGRPVLLIEIEERHTGRAIEDDLEFVMQLGYDGYFAIGDRIEPLTVFDGDRHHRNRDRARGYVYNFIFLPHGRHIDWTATKATSMNSRTGAFTR